MALEATRVHSLLVHAISLVSLCIQRALQWFRQEPEEQRQRDIKLYTTLLNDVKKRMADGTAPDCLASQTLVSEGYGPEAEESKKKRTLSELDIAYTVSSPFGAGIETVGFAFNFVLSILTLVF